jgi:hypothetical protein
MQTPTSRLVNNTIGEEANEKGRADRKDHQTIGPILVNLGALSK